MIVDTWFPSNSTNLSAALTKGIKEDNVLHLSVCPSRALLPSSSSPFESFPKIKKKNKHILIKTIN